MPPPRPSPCFAGGGRSTRRAAGALADITTSGERREFAVRAKGEVMVPAHGHGARARLPTTSRPEAERRFLVGVEPVHAPLDLGGDAAPLEAERAVLERGVEGGDAPEAHVLERLAEALDEVGDVLRHRALVDDGSRDALRDLDL